METYNGCFNEILWINACKKSESYLLCYMSSYSMIFGVYDCIRLSNIHRRRRIPNEERRERYGKK